MNSLHAQLQRVRRRLLSIGAAAAIVWAVVAVSVLLLLGAWLDLLWEFSPSLRIAAVWASGVAGAAVLIAWGVASVFSMRDAVLARRLDRAGDGGGRILTGWELALGRYGIRGRTHSPLSAGLAGVAIADAAEAAKRVPLGQVAPAVPFVRSLTALLLLAVAVGLLAVCLPGVAWTQWNRFRRPLDDIPPFSSCQFKIEPGDVEVVYGGELEIRATVVGGIVDPLELVLESSSGTEPPVPMFPESGGVWRAVLAKVVEPMDYHVRADRARSRRYHVRVKTVPRIENARLRIVPPRYADRAAYEGPLPKDGVCGLPGTQVEVFLRSNRPLRGGTMTIAGARSDRSRDRSPRSSPPRNLEVALRPVEPGSQEVVGRFSIAGDGRFECRVIDEAGQTSQQSFSGGIVMLADQRPFVRLLEPQRTALATPTATLPVTLSAEDDCGISRLQLFRSLNESRPLPADLPRSARQRRRADASVRLPLDRYGLEPGDVITLFGRVEDNDPAGAKGAESPIATVRIVSQEEFNRIFRTREGIQAMLSKYDQARRRMESLAEQVEELRKKIDKLPKDEKLSQAMRDELQRLQKAMTVQADAIRKLAAHTLPYDLDKFLTPKLDELAAIADDVAKNVGGLRARKNLCNGKLSSELATLASRLDRGRRRFKQRVSEPLEYFEAVFRLLNDQQRFVQLAQWQRDLAGRLASLKGQDRKDDPAAKARMRDLEEEQRQVGDALAKLLEDIMEHSERLPQTKELESLRKTAQQFVRDVRASGAVEAIGQAESALAEFAATEAHRNAKRAAEILDRFIARCKGGMGDLACKCLRFQPQLSAGMGNTLQQLLEEAGAGIGNGMMDGYGMVGLYGGLPELVGDGAEYGEMREAHEGRGAGHGKRPNGENPDELRPGELLVPGSAAGAVGNEAPMRYRRQIGQYFERIAEETETK
ncbi:MAG: hypothetical protein ABFC77_11635 [Thermoguttaceae bacterium]